jgi:hypothetical protein
VKKWIGTDRIKWNKRNLPKTINPLTTLTFKEISELKMKEAENSLK